MRDLHLAGAWLARHGLVDTGPTPALAARLRARVFARLADSVTLAGLILAAALTQVYQLRRGEGGPGSRAPVLALASLVVGLLVARSLLDRWMRGVDRRAAAGLVRRAAHAVPPGWRTVVGVPYAAFAAATRHLLTRPVVAEDEDSLTADVIMRIEDAREATAPTVLWSLPVVVLFGTAPGRWNAASLILVVVGLIALVAINVRAPRVGVTARQATAAR